jgi:hypothetical protein
MPRKPIEWSKCIIYKIWKDDEFYIGSTTDFTNRKRRHKHNCNNEKNIEYNIKLYQTIREKGGWNTWQMTPLEEYKECQTQVQARIREEEWRVKLNANLNTNKVFVAETKQEYDKIYRNENKEKLKEYREEHKKEIKNYQSQWYQEHKEELNIKSFKYREEHKEKLQKKINCECGGKYTHSTKSKHIKTQKHQKYLTTI